MANTITSPILLTDSDHQTLTSTFLLFNLYTEGHISISYTNEIIVETITYDAFTITGAAHAVIEAKATVSATFI